MYTSNHLHMEFSAYFHVFGSWHINTSSVLPSSTSMVIRQSPYPSKSGMLYSTRLIKILIYGPPWLADLNFQGKPQRDCFFFYIYLTGRILLLFTLRFLYFIFPIIDGFYSISLYKKATFSFIQEAFFPHFLFECLKIILLSIYNIFWYFYNFQFFTSIY